MEAQEVSGVLYYTIFDNVVKKNDSGRYYIETPSTTVGLPFGVDIKKIAPKKGRAYTPAQLGFEDLYAGLVSSTLENQIGYVKNGNTIEFENMTASNNPDKVDISMVLPFDSLDEDDAINIPQDMIDQAVDLLVIEFKDTLGIPADQTSNSIDNP
jgi:hypothetical protein